MECGVIGKIGPSVRAAKEVSIEWENVQILRTTANPALGKVLNLDSAVQALHVKVRRDWPSIKTEADAMNYLILISNISNLWSELTVHITTTTFNIWNDLRCLQDLWTVSGASGRPGAPVMQPVAAVDLSLKSGAATLLALNMEELCVMGRTRWLRRVRDLLVRMWKVKHISKVSPHNWLDKHGSLSGRSSQKSEKSFFAFLTNLSFQALKSLPLL